MLLKRSGAVLIIVLALPVPPALFADDMEQIGTVVTSQGSVAARASNGALRTLQRRSQIFVGDTLVVGADGFTSLRMIDNAHLSLGPATEFSFKSYRYDANPATRDSVVMSLARGCFRAVVGRASATSRDEYRIDTPIASISTENAFHGAALVGERLYTETWDGLTVVANAVGSIRLGEYGGYAHSRTFSGSAPEGLSALLPGTACEPPESLDEALDEKPDYGPRNDSGLSGR